MKRALLALALLAPAPAEAAIRALFVGVNQYQFSSAREAGAQFADLKGTVNDVAHIKAALRDVYGLDLDKSGENCASSNAISTTLIDKCATGAAIWREFDAKIAQSAPGDTVLFFFAGHGALIRDDRVFDQASGNNTTILPTDARDPDAVDLVEILDRDIGKRIDEANARGVNVVTIFDSCYSEGGARGDAGEGQSRDAPPIDARLKPHPMPTLPPSGFAPAGRGYRVHLAAARENEKSREIPAEGQTAGIFTTQLSATLRDMPGATFDDILVETRRKIEQLGQGPQSPRGSGALTARLGGSEARIILLQATASGGVATLQAGRLSGVTSGSRFELYPGSTAALTAGTKPLAIATVAAVAANSAALTLDPGAATLPARLVARETQHAYGMRDLLIRNLAAPADRAAVSAAIKTGAVASEGEPAQLVVKPGDGATLHLWTAGGQDLADLGPVSDRRFGGILAQETAKVARVNDLIGLRTDPAKAGLGFCISNDLTYDPQSCPPLVNGARRTLIVDENSRLVARNLMGTRYLYVIGIDERFGVALLLPEPGNAGAVDGSRPLVRSRRMVPTTTGAYRFVTIATSERIDAAAFEQAATGARGEGSCGNALQRALCAAMRGTRDADAPRVGDWTAIVTDVDVVPGGSK